MEYCKKNKEFAIVVAAGYDEYATEDNGVEVLPEDWALFRAKSSRIGKNIFPARDGCSEIRFSSLGELKVRAKVTMNGAISGRVEGEIFDRMTFILDDHDTQLGSEGKTEIQIFGKL